MNPNIRAILALHGKLTAAEAELVALDNNRGDYAHDGRDFYLSTMHQTEGRALQRYIQKIRRELVVRSRAEFDKNSRVPADVAGIVMQFVYGPRK